MREGAGGAEPGGADRARSLRLRESRGPEAAGFGHGGARRAPSGREVGRRVGREDHGIEAEGLGYPAA